jgi:alanine racemase
MASSERVNFVIFSEVIAVIKANAYGHGAVAVARHLSNNGIQHFAVATAAEGQELRQAGVQGYIQIFGK